MENSNEGLTKPSVVRLSEWSSRFSDLVAERFGETAIWIEGDVGGYHLHPRSGHVYIDLVEIGHDGLPCAKAKANMWRTVAQSVLPKYHKNAGQHLSMGQRIQVLVKTQYAPAYGLTFTVLDLRPAGESAHEARRTALRAWAQAQPWWLSQSLLAKPQSIQRVALLTPKSAAGGEDAWKALEPFALAGVFHVKHIDIVMQGAGVDASWRQAFEKIHEQHLVAPFDVVLVVRGGGASLDVTSLDSRVTMEMVGTCPAPVWTGIGHERDETLVDNVAAHAWGTPSKAAEGVCESVVREATLAQQSWLSATKAAQNACSKVATRVEHKKRTIQSEIKNQLNRVGIITQKNKDRVKLASTGILEKARDNTAKKMNEILHLGPTKTLSRGYFWINQNGVRGSASQLVDGSLEIHGKDGSRAAEIQFKKG